MALEVVEAMHLAIARVQRLKDNFCAGCHCHDWRQTPVESWVMVFTANCLHFRIAAERFRAHLPDSIWAGAARGWPSGLLGSECSGLDQYVSV